MDAVTASPSSDHEALLRELGETDDVQRILKVVCQATGLGFAAVAHVTEDRWVACQVRDEIGFGLPAGGELPVKTTLCDTVRGTRDSIVIDDVPNDPVYAGHHTPATYGLQSYIAFPIVLADGEIFGTLCGIDPRPHKLDTPQIRGMFALFANLVGTHVARIRAKAEAQAVREREAFLSSLLAASRDCVTVLSLDGRIEFMNDRGAELLRLDLGQVRGLELATLWPEGERARLREAVAAAAAGEAQSLEACRPNPDGEARWWNMGFAPLDMAGLPKLLAVSRNVTARMEADLGRKRVTEELRELNETLQDRVAQALAEKKVYADVVESSSAAVTALGLDYRILAINQANIDAFQAAFGKTPKAGDDFLSLFDTPEALEMQTSIWSRALAGERFVMTGEFGSDPFEKRYYEVRFTPLLNQDGERIGASSTSHDVTERVRAQALLVTAQEQLRQSQKMEAMGQLTGGVAHDFNNLLTPIVATLDIIQRKGVAAERVERLVGAAAQSAERARTLVQRLLAFARRQPLQPSPIDLFDLVGGMTDLIASTVGPRIQLRIEVPSGLPPVRGDANQLEMALLNLSVNARDAMPEGGELRIFAGVEQVGDAQEIHLDAGDYVRLSVADSGEGMDEATLARAIEPFFSTKGVGKGTGLGLSMVDGLARQLGGSLAIASQSGQGTRIDLWLQVSDAAPRAAAAIAPQPAALGGAGVVLLVDDEELVRLATADMLAELGYEVVEAASAEAALGRLRAGLSPDFVVTDHLMPGMSGADLARALSDENPRVPVLIISGYAEAGSLSTDFARLSKPFRSADLAAMLGSIRAG